MPGRGSTNRKQAKSEYKQLVSSLKGACPPHKHRDLEKLVQDLGGDEDLIQQRISEWWAEPVPQDEGEWEQINKKNNSNNQSTGRGGRGGRGRGRGGGRGRDGVGGRGGRGGRGRGRGRESNFPNGQRSQSVDHKSRPLPENQNAATSAKPKASRNGAWSNNKSSTPDEPLPAAPVSMVEVPVPTPPPENVPPIKAVSGPPGNVWATKGTAHIIRAEHQKPKPAPPKQPSPPTLPPPETSTTPEEIPIAPQTESKLPALETATESLQIESTPPTPVAPESPVEAVVEPPSAAPIGAAPSSEPANAWGQSVAEPIPSSPVPADPVPAIAPEPELPPSAITQPIAPEVENKRPKGLLNMGHWDTTTDDTDDNLDFGFGSFGADADVQPSTTSAATTTAQDSSASGPSPARPPPGLSIRDMPPGMPANALLAHELENKLEEASLTATTSSAQQISSDAAIASSGNETQTTGTEASSTAVTGHTHGASLPVTSAGGLPGPNTYGNQAQNHYSAPGMAAVYSYGTANGFMQGAGTPVLGAPKPGNGGLYGVQPAPSSGNATNAVANSNDNSTAGPGPLQQPPGMPNMYGNPPMYYNQHPQAPFYMNHQATGGIGYNYGHGGQFGAFGYPHIGQSPGYPPYDENGGGSYNTGKGGRGYGRPNGQYGGPQQNQQQQPAHQQPPTHPQPGHQYTQPYQPYMGYHHGHGDHFSRGGYGGMQDHYGIQQHTTYGGGFNQDDGHDQYKGGKKGGNRGGMSQFHHQAGPHPHAQHIGQQGGFGLHGSNNNAQQQQQSNPSGGGWSNNPGWGASGGGGVPSWQGNK